jgi:Kiwa protein KwaB-like
MSPQVPNSSAAAEAALASAANLGQGETQILLFSSVGVGQFDVRRVNPTQNIANRFREIASRWAQARARDRTFVAYAAGRKPADYELSFLAIQGSDSIENVIASMAEPIAVGLYSEGDDEFDSDLRFYVVAAHVPNPGWVYFFKAKGESLRLKRTSKIPLVPSGNVYDELAADPLMFDETFDAVVADGYALMVNQATFERSLAFVEQARAAATATLDQLLATVQVTNAADFLTAAGTDLNMVSKLRSIAEKMATSRAYSAAMTTAKLIEFAEKQGIPIDTEEVEGVRQFVFHPDPQHRWRILKLMDDDYLHSSLTDTDYEVNSKRPYH